MPSKISSTASAKKKSAQKLDYPLQGSSLDVPLPSVLALSPEQRTAYIKQLISAFTKIVKSDDFALKKRTSFKTEMKDLRKLFYSAADQYLFTDDKNGRRWVLGKGSPGSTHVYWSRNHIWKMKTKGGSLQELILEKSPKLVKTIEKLLDPNNKTKEGFRNRQKSSIPNILKYLEFNNGAGCAFPPFHAKFLADRYLPHDGAGLVLDPCAGWGGRLLGTLLVNRDNPVHYVGIDPEERNRAAYEGLTRRATVWLKREIGAERGSTIFSIPFEDWIESREAEQFFGKVDLIMTSPPYFGAENYNPDNPKQSANRYDEYLAWRERFYRVLFSGAFKLLKPNGVFVLNIADVSETGKHSLERDARKLAAEEGFVGAGFYKLAMSMTPSTRKAGNARHVVSTGGKEFKHEPVFVFRKAESKVAPKPKTERQLTPKTTTKNSKSKNLPYPSPVVEEHEGFFVVRDDLLKYGSKIRFLDNLVSTCSEEELVYGASNKVGWGAISLAYACKRHGKKAICFMAKRKELTWHQSRFVELGGEIEFVSNGMLTVTQKAARDYVAKAPKKRRLIPMGMGEQLVHEAIVKVATSLPIKPTEIWTVASSGTLTRGLQAAFPEAKVFAVQIGHKLSEEEAGRAKVFVSPYKYDESIKAGDAPPYPSEPYYDAKVWSFVRRHGSKGALIWNVA